MSFDIAIVGAGPAGLCFARSMSGCGLRIALIERQDEATLQAPPDDGREIAITHHSQRLLRDLGVWSRLHDEEIGILRDALVINGNRRDGLNFRHDEAGKPQLGWLLSNHAIRRAAYAEVSGLPDVQILAGVRVISTQTDGAGVQIALDNGERLRASLVVAADSRFSDLRRDAGIAADMHDFGKTMLVCRMRHAMPHRQTALEWFGAGQTLALLPLHDAHTSSVVITLPAQPMQALLALDDVALAADVTARFQQRMGAMSVAGPRCAYPLVGVYARRFVAERFALIGDAAVGMHPLTAHGFNFGLRGQATLARELRQALASGEPIWNTALLQRYERTHRIATRPLYMATQLLANLYTDDRLPARALRHMALAAAARLRPFRRLVVSQLAGDHRGALLLPATCQ